MLYSDGKGHYQDEYNRLWNALVPKSGEADTVQGELVRAIGKLASELYRNGNINWCQSFRRLTTILRQYLRDKNIFNQDTILQIERDIEELRENGRCGAWSLYEKMSKYKEEDPYDRITDRVVEWCNAYSNPIPFPKG